MTQDRKKTVLAGSLYIAGTIAGVLSIAPAIDSADYLTKAAADSTHVLLAALFQFILTAAYLGFAIVLYPVLRKFRETSALGFLSFRIVAAVMNLIGFLCLLVLLLVSQEYLKASNPVTSYYQVFGDLLKQARDFVNHVAMILSISLGGLLFYHILYTTKLLPRWVAFCGISGTLLTMVASILVMFRLTEVITTTYLAMNMPLIILEMIVAIWLIAKGFENSILYKVQQEL